MPSLHPVRSEGVVETGERPVLGLLRHDMAPRIRRGEQPRVVDVHPKPAGAPGQPGRRLELLDHRAERGAERPPTEADPRCQVGPAPLQGHVRGVRIPPRPVRRADEPCPHSVGCRFDVDLVANVDRRPGREEPIRPSDHRDRFIGFAEQRRLVWSRTPGSPNSSPRERLRRTPERRAFAGNRRTAVGPSRRGRGTDRPSSTRPERPAVVGPPPENVRPHDRAPARDALRASGPTVGQGIAGRSTVAACSAPPGSDRAGSTRRTR